MLSFLKNSFSLIILRLQEFILAPTQNPDMIWMLIPIVFTLIVMEFYFGRYKSERLGWGSATGNSLVLILISMDLLRNLYQNNNLSFLFMKLITYSDLATFVVFIVLAEGLLIFILDFLHLWPEFFAFRVSSFLVVNLLAYIGVTLIYSGIILDMATLAAVVIFFIIFSAVFFFARMLIPRAK